MKFLVFQHVAYENPGLIKKWADEKEVVLDVIELWKPYKIPEVLDYNGLIIMGGPMGVYENYPSEKDEIEVIEKALGKVPIIGFCLGSQLLAHALGSKVYPNMINGKRIKEIGYYDVDLTDVGKSNPILKGFSSPMKVFQWHGDGFDLPDGAKLLASNSNCKNQAFVYGSPRSSPRGEAGAGGAGKNAYGFLFHFEFSPDMVENQIKIDREWTHQDFDLDEEKLKQEAKENASLMESQCRMLFDNFMNKKR